MFVHFVVRLSRSYNSSINHLKTADWIRETLFYVILALLHKTITESIFYISIILVLEIVFSQRQFYFGDKFWSLKLGGESSASMILAKLC